LVFSIAKLRLIDSIRHALQFGSLQPVRVATPRDRIEHLFYVSLVLHTLSPSR
jgi:hypothetical protein